MEAKHKAYLEELAAKVDAKLLEFLLYQTGILIRMVLSVKQAQETEVLDHPD